MHVTNRLLLQIASITVGNADKYFVPRVRHLQLRLPHQEIRFVFVMHVMTKLYAANIEFSDSSYTQFLKFMNERNVPL